MRVGQLHHLRYGSSGDDTVRGVSDFAFALVRTLSEWRAILMITRALPEHIWSRAAFLSGGVSLLKQVLR